MTFRSRANVQHPPTGFVLRYIEFQTFCKTSTTDTNKIMNIWLQFFSHR